MKYSSTRSLAVIGALIGLLAAILSWIPLGFWMYSYQKRTGYDAGNAGVLGCFAVLLFPAVGGALGAIVGSVINRKAR